jgi:hypothetical protein
LVPLVPLDLLGLLGLMGLLDLLHQEDLQKTKSNLKNELNK